MSTCISPDTDTKKTNKMGSVAVANMRHCEDGWIYLECDFTPKNLGAKVLVQGQFKVDGQKGSKAVTAKVEFWDNGVIRRYGDATFGVRFAAKKFDMKQPHTCSVDVYFF